MIDDKSPEYWAEFFKNRRLGHELDAVDEQSHALKKLNRLCKKIVALAREQNMAKMPRSLVELYLMDNKVYLKWEHKIVLHKMVNRELEN